MLARRWARHRYLERVTAVSLTLDHLHDLLVDRFAILISITPIITGARTCLPDEEVLGIVYVFVRAGLDVVYDTGLEVDKDGPGDIAGIVALVVEDIFAVAAFGREVLEIPILVDPMFLAELLPKLTAN